MLKGAQRELWLTFLIKFLIYTAYSVTNKTMVLWLSRDLGFSDQAAGALVGWVWAPAMTVFTLLAGSLTDAIGLRRTFFLGVAICTFARSVMVVTTIPSLALICGVLPLAVGEALGTPVLLAATRDYSTTRQRSMSFSIIYMVMNIGYVVAGWIFDYVRQLDLRIQLFGFQPTTHQQLFFVSLAIEVLIFPAIYFLRRGEAEKAKRGRMTAGTSWLLAAHRRNRAAKRSRYHPAFRRLVGQSAFRSHPRLLPPHRISQGHLPADGLCLSEIWRSRAGLSCAGRQARQYQRDSNHFPRAHDRGADAALRRLSHGRDRRRHLCGGRFHHGVAAGVVHLCGEQPVRQWLGHGYLGLEGSINPYYVMAALYLMVFSVGEAFYSPRVYEYAAAIAPAGQEASYGALAYLPFLVGKLLVGTSGWILAAFCPAEGPRRPAMMWLIFALAASVAPIGLLLFSRYIRLPEAGRSEAA